MYYSSERGQAPMYGYHYSYLSLAMPDYYLCMIQAINDQSFSSYFLTRRACLTKFSMTPSKASLSPNALSLFFNQYSSTSLALEVKSSNVVTCVCSSWSLILDNAASVVAQRSLAA